MLAQLANSSLECIENSLTIQKSRTRNWNMWFISSKLSFPTAARVDCMGEVSGVA